MVDHSIYTQILNEELVPALGCTEPISLAFGAATCRRYLTELPERVTIACSGNIIKNVKSVVVPNTNGMKGIEAAIAIGLTSGDDAKKLEVLSDVDSEGIRQAEAFLQKNIIEVSLLDSEAKLHFIVEMFSKNHSTSVEIIHTHTNIIRILQDGTTVFSKEFFQENTKTPLLEHDLLTIEEIINYSENVAIADIEGILTKQIECNSAICHQGLTEGWGAKVGKHIIESQGSGLLSRLKAVTAAGSDARMSGCDSAVIINSGSGNQGLTASIPVIEFAKSNNVSRENTLRALALSNLVAIHHKSKIGWLSAYCGVSTAACGAGAAMTWLKGGTKEQIYATITNSSATISGMICDGAKPSCAAKIAVAVESAYLGHIMAMAGECYAPGDGVIKNSMEETIAGIGEIASVGMNETDKVILSVMLR